MGKYRRKRDKMAQEPHVCDGIDLKWMYASDSEDEDDWISSTPVILTQEVSLRGRFRRLLFRKSKARLGATIFDILVKFLMCIIYLVRVQLDDFESYRCFGQVCTDNITEGIIPQNEEDGMLFSSAEIYWYVLIWVHRPLPLWICEVLLATATLTKALLFIFISKGNKLEQMARSVFVLEFVCSLPVIITLCYPPYLIDLYIPTFLNCWLTKSALEKLFNDLHLTKQRFQTISVTMSQQLLILVATLCCLIFTTVCGIQHIQRASSEKQLTMFESFYFTVVTFSTVGYGDISPDIWLGQLFMVIMICVAIAFIPRQIEGIASVWIERQKGGGEYGKRRAQRNKHVVVCSKHLTADSIMDFLTEFFAHSKLEEHNVILLSSDELDSNMHVILCDPKWANRVIYMRGSALKEADLKRCRMHDADAVFILAPGNCFDKDLADQHTILRSWAVKDFAPQCNQYIQLFRAENKMHVWFAEHVVCEDEFKYALLANNCLYPGLSTLVSLLVHTSTGYEGDLASESWMQMYGRHSGNEIYHIQLCKSVFFSQYEGSSFTDASVDAHAQYGVTLLGVMDSDTDLDDPNLLLNPGPNYTLKASDFCFYMSITKEEYSKIQSSPKRNSKSKKSPREKSYEKVAKELQNFLEDHDQPDDGTWEGGEESVFNTITSQRGLEYLKVINSKWNPEITQQSVNETIESQRSEAENLFNYKDMNFEDFVTGPPPTFLKGNKKTKCHLVKNRRHDCCLKWGENCCHVTYKNANDERWDHRLIILAAEQFNLGICNFIVPLRSEFISKKSLSPIILLLEEEPHPIFLDTIAHFPLVYWMTGGLKNVDDLLRAGITKASHLVVVNRSSNLEVEEVLADSETIVAVQTISKFFPNTNIITELSQTSNMKFMQFQAHDEYSQKVARVEKKLRENMRTSLTHIFRLPFAAGQVFSSSMLDTLLYQTYVKGYLIKFARLLLGIDAEQNSGHLSSIKVKRDILQKYKTYGEVYRGLCSVTGEIPIAIYRTEMRKSSALGDDVDSTNNNRKIKKPPKKVSLNVKQFFEKAEKNDISDLVKNRMQSLSMDVSHYCHSEQKRKPLSYIITNPHPNTRLKKGDMLYVIQPSSMYAIPSQLGFNLRRRQSWSEGNRSAPKYTDIESRSRSHSVDTNILPTKTVGFQIPNKRGSDSVEYKSPTFAGAGDINPQSINDRNFDFNFNDSTDVDNDISLPKASSAIPGRERVPVFKFSVTDTCDEVDAPEFDFSSLDEAKHVATSGTGDGSTSVQGQKEDANRTPRTSTCSVNIENENTSSNNPKIVITRTPTKIFTTERVDEPLLE